MATWDYPTTLMPQDLSWGSVKAGAQSTSIFNSATESIEFPGERWLVSLTLPERKSRNGGEAEAFFGRISGGMERVRLWHFLRPVPRGSMRGAPTLAAAASRGELSLQITTTGTLEAGDLFKVGNQVFQAFQSCAPVGGVLTVPLVQRVRSTLAAGAAVQWDKPTALFVMPSKTHRTPYRPGAQERIAVDFEEVYL